MKSILFSLSFLSLWMIHVPSQAQTYKDIAPILYANCTSCHHSGGLEFSLMSYSDILPYGNSILNDVNNNVMPPWPADPSYRHYVKERVLSTSDKNAIITWVANGMPAGDTTLAPPPPVYGTAQLYGTPDLILNLPLITSTSTTTDKYFCVNVPSGLTQDRYIRAFEYMPGNAAMIHHAVITIDTTGLAQDDLSGTCYNFQGQLGIGDYAPGMGPTVLPGVAPAKFGFRLKAGSKLSFQIHIPEGTAGQTDQSQIRLYFYPTSETGIRDMLFETALQHWNFSIGANSVASVTQKYPTGNNGLPIDISLYACFPHSHNTCVSILNNAYKGTDTIPLIRIPKWDFHWQGQYVFKNLVKIPTQYHLFAKHVFDNTVNNPLTPDPNQPVMAGTNTNDEMLFDSFLYTLYQSGDENIDIEAILLNDPIFYPTGLSVFNTISDYSVFPNPTSNTLSIHYSLATSQMVKLSLLNLQGEVVSELESGIETAGHHELRWEKTDHLYPGHYLIRIQAGKDEKSLNVLIR